MEMVQFRENDEEVTEKLGRLEKRTFLNLNHIQLLSGGIVGAGFGAGRTLPETGGDLLPAIKGMDTKVAVAMHIFNATKVCLVPQDCFANGSEVQTKPPTVGPALAEGFIVGSHRHFPACSHGTASWKIGSTNNYLVVSWYVPVTHLFFCCNNWLMVGITDRPPGGDCFTQLYGKKEGSWYRSRRFTNVHRTHQSLAFSAVVAGAGNMGFHVVAYMGGGHRTSANIVLMPDAVEELENSLREFILEEVAITPKNCSSVYNSNSVMTGGGGVEGGGDGGSAKGGGDGGSAKGGDGGIKGDCGGRILKARLASLAQLQTQLLAAMTVSLSFLAGGEVRAWSSSAIPSMEGLNNDTTYGNFTLPFVLSTETTSWISTLAPLGALLGGCCCSFPMNVFGRKPMVLFSALLFLFSYLLLGSCSITESIGAMLAARGIQGFGLGLSIPAAQNYISESHMRGLLGSVPALFIALGTLITYIVGAFFPWNYLSYYSALFPLILVISMFLLPETPVWLVSHGKDEEARKSLEWLRGGKDISSELSMLQESNKRVVEAAAAEEGTFSVITSLFQRQVLLPLFISMGLMFFQHWCGLTTIIFYTVYIFNKAGSTIDKNLATIVIGLVQFLATLLSVFLVDIAGRRILLLISGAIMSISMAVVGAFFYLKDQDKHQEVEFLPLLALVVFMVGFSMGFASIPYLLMGELFPNKDRSLLGAISGTFNIVNLFLVIKLFTSLEALVGLYGLFWIYAAISALSCAFVLLFVPETKGKSLEEIEASFKK